LTKLPDLFCKVPSRDEVDGVRKLCAADILGLYSRAGAIDSDHRQVVAVDESLNMIVKVNGTTRDGRESIRHGEKVTIDIAPAGTLSYGKLDWSVSVTAVNQRNDPHGPYKGFNFFVRNFDGHYDPEDKANPMQVVWDNNFWEDEKVREALRTTLDFEIIVHVKQAGGAGGEFFSQHHISIEPPSVAIFCQGGLTHVEGETIMCDIKVRKSIESLHLSKLGVKLEVAGQAITAQEFPVQFEELVEEKGTDSTMLVASGLKHSLTSGSKRRVAVTAVITSNELPPLTGSVQMLINHKPVETAAA